MQTFFTRFFRQQYKRSCMPDGPKVGTVSLSPRGDWRMPSDADPLNGWAGPARETSRRRVIFPARRIRPELPGLPDQVMAEVVMRSLAGQPKSSPFIDRPGGMQHVIGPERDLTVAGRAGKAARIRRPAGCRRRTREPRARPAAGASLAVVAECLTRRTEPTAWPSISAIQERSHFRVKILDKTAPRFRRPVPRIARPTHTLVRRSRHGDGQSSPCHPAGADEEGKSPALLASRLAGVRSSASRRPAAPARLRRACRESPPSPDVHRHRPVRKPSVPAASTATGVAGRQPPLPSCRSSHSARNHGESGSDSRRPAPVRGPAQYGRGRV